MIANYEFFLAIVSNQDRAEHGPSASYIGYGMRIAKIFPGAENMFSGFLLYHHDLGAWIWTRLQKRCEKHLLQVSVFGRMGIWSDFGKGKKIFWDLKKNFRHQKHVLGFPPARWRNRSLNLEKKRKTMWKASWPSFSLWEDGNLWIQNGSLKREKQFSGT